MAETYEFEEVGPAADGVRKWLFINEAALPETLRDRLMALASQGMSPVTTIVEFTKAVWANQDAFDDDAKRIAAAAAEVIQMKGFHAGMDGRANAISNALRRETGLVAPEGRTWPAAEEDPEIDTDWIAPIPPEPLEPAGEEG